MRYDVVYCFDGNYEAHFGASLMSLLLNFRGPGEELRIHVVTPHEAPGFLQRLQALRVMFRCSIDRVPPQGRHESWLAQLPVQSDVIPYMKRATWYRLLVPELLPPEVDRVLYLDADTIVLECVSRLFAEAEPGAPLQGVVDAQGELMARHHGLRQYVNSGVLLMGLDAWRRGDHLRGCLATAQAHAQQLRYADQCALNLHFGDQIRPLSRRWNQPVEEARSAATEPGGILHFITRDKPWQGWYRHPCGELYWRYRRASPWNEGEAEAPTTVGDLISLARKTAGQGRFADAVQIYEQVLRSIVQHQSRQGGAGGPGRAVPE